MKMSYRKMKLAEIGKIVSGATPKTSTPDNFGGDIAWITPADLSGYTKKYISHGKRNITEMGYNSCSTQLMPKGSVLFSSRAPIGYVAIAENPLCTNQGFKSIVPNDLIDSEFLYYQLKYLSKSIQDKGTGTTFKEISAKTLGKIEIVVPLLSEQKNIVSRIEELFSKLDKGVETLQTIKQQLAVYRQAVLKEAFEGKLTERWRQNIENYPLIVRMDLEKIKIKSRAIRDTSGDENEAELFLPSAWKKVRIGNLFEVEVGATPSRKKFEYWNGNVNWVSSGEITFNNIFHTKEQITEDGLYSSSTNIQPIGTVMLAMIGEGKTRGRAAILQVEAAHNQNTAAILVSKTPCQPKYLYYFLQMNYENTRRIGSGNNQKALNKERVRAMRFPFTSFAEQSQIIQEIESRLSVCDSIEQTVDEALARADAMRQSILKQAFEGEI